MRTYLVVIDETPEAAVALRFAARRAAGTGGKVLVLTVVERFDFVAFGGIQATMEDEARDHAEALVADAAGTIIAEGGARPEILVETGNAVTLVRDLLASHSDIAALVLGAAASGMPGPLITKFTGPDAGSLPCPIMIVPGALGPDALDRLS